MCSNPFSPKQSGLNRFCSSICKDNYESRKTNMIWGFLREKLINPIKDELRSDVISDTKVRKSGEMSTVPVIPIKKIKKYERRHPSHKSAEEVIKKIEIHKGLFGYLNIDKSKDDKKKEGK